MSRIRAGVTYGGGYRAEVVAAAAALMVTKAVMVKTC